MMCMKHQHVTSAPRLVIKLCVGCRRQRHHAPGKTPCHAPQVKLGLHGLVPMHRIQILTIYAMVTLAMATFHGRTFDVAPGLLSKLCPRCRLPSPPCTWADTTSTAGCCQYSLRLSACCCGYGCNTLQGMSTAPCMDTRLCIDMPQSQVLDLADSVNVVDIYPCAQAVS